MPMHKGWLPREGFTSEVLLPFLDKTALNPALLLPLVLLARFTKKGENMSILHPLAFSRIKSLLYIGLAKAVNDWLSNKALNNWTTDKYVWPKEIVVVTGGAGGIGGHVVRLLAETGAQVVVLDIQPLTYDAPSNVHYFECDITSIQKLAAVAKEIRAQIGEPTVLINNAGVARGKNILNASERDIRFTFDVNTFAGYWTVREFLPSMVKRNHGMVVTVTSYAAWITAPDMVDYAASKAAAYAFHEGLTAELKTRFNAPRVRTIVVNQGYTKTALFQGYQNDSRFLVPTMEPETVAEAVVRQVLSGRSGQVIVPRIGTIFSSLAGTPHWWQLGLRSEMRKLMTNFSGRQVVQDLDKFYSDREKTGTEESTVLVPKAD